MDSWSWVFVKARKYLVRASFVKGSNSFTTSINKRYFENAMGIIWELMIRLKWLLYLGYGHESLLAKYKF